jgi:opacity protein-like surface antigen
MREILHVSLFALLAAPAALGQRPVFAGAAAVLEAGAGYSYVDANVPSESRLGMNGVQLVANADVHQRFGAKLDLSYGRCFDAFGSGRSADMFTYMAGPVLYPLRKRNMNVYTHLLLGGARETGVNFESSGQMVLGFVNKFAWAGGAGVQYQVSRSLSLRVGADYLHTSFFNSNIMVQGQSNIRSSVNLIYTFGRNRE